MADNSLLLVFYTNVDHSEFARISQNIENKIKSDLTLLNEATIFILPDTSLSFGSIKLECVNPKVMDKDKYEEISKKLKQISEEIKK